ncbi:MAG: flavodoxin-dependent (E)-4-hydroxy-3-methylbut-2-enyl-diphosphate synthase [Nitrospirota bacterium]
MNRRYSRMVQVGSLTIGGDAPISVQSMTKTDTRDIAATVSQINRLKEAGCEIVRVAVPDMEAAKALGAIKKQINIPLVADIHFDYRLALEAIGQGVDKLRLNPGNIKQKDKVVKIVEKAKERNIPIRIGVNSGSIDKKRFGKPTAAGLVESALEHIKILEDLGFFDIIISLKATDVPMTIEAYQLMATKVDYPFHLGITEAGLPWAGGIKSAVGIGSLLALGLGDTIRVSLTADPVEEVKVGYEILKALQLRHTGYELISCPTCGRCEIDLIKVATAVEEKISNFQFPISNFQFKIAIMGCVVNGPGEAAEADIGIAGGCGVGLIFKKGKIIKKVEEKDLVNTLLQEIHSMVEGEKGGK